EARLPAFRFKQSIPELASTMQTVAGQPHPWRPVEFSWRRSHVTEGIDIVAASYGANCAQFVPPRPFRSRFTPGNATLTVRDECTGRTSCDFTVNDNLVDPVNSCAKDFEVDYRCLPGGGTRRESISADAFGKTLTLDCTPEPSSGIVI